MFWRRSEVSYESLPYMKIFIIQFSLVHLKNHVPFLSPFNLFNAKDGLDRNWVRLCGRVAFLDPPEQSGLHRQCLHLLKAAFRRMKLATLGVERNRYQCTSVCLPMWWSGNFKVLFWWHCKHSRLPFLSGTEETFLHVVFQISYIMFRREKFPG